MEQSIEFSVVGELEQIVADIENQIIPPNPPPLNITPLSLGRQVGVIFCVFIIIPPVVIILIYVYIWLGKQAGII